MVAQAKCNAPPRPLLSVGDRVRVRVEPKENRAYRVTETAWTEQTYLISKIDYTLQGWAGGSSWRVDQHWIHEIGPSRDGKIKVQM